MDCVATEEQARAAAEHAEAERERRRKLGMPSKVGRWPRITWRKTPYRRRAVHAFPTNCVSLCGRISNLDYTEAAKLSPETVCLTCARLAMKFLRPRTKKGHNT